VLVLRRVVVGVFGEIAELTSTFDGMRKLETARGAALLEFLLQALERLGLQVGLGHCPQGSRRLNPSNICEIK